MPFLNADEIAKTLPKRFVGNRELESGRQLLERFGELTGDGKSFALETTLANRSLAPRFRELQRRGYFIYLFFIYAPSPELCLARVAARVRRGGHDIPEKTVRRRWRSGLENLMGLYFPIVDECIVLATADATSLRPIARIYNGKPVAIAEPDTWVQIQEQIAT